MRDMHEYIENRIGRVMDFVNERSYSMIRFTEISKSSADGQADHVKGHLAIGTDQEANDDVRRLGSGGWGVAAVPPAGEPALVARAGGGPLNGFIIACGSKRYFPANMGDGDVALYCKQSGTTVYLKASDGSVALTDKGGATLKLDGSGNVSATAATGGTASLSSDPTGTVKLGPVGTLAVLVQGTQDGIFGVPVVQAAAAVATVVKAG